MNIRQFLLIFAMILVPAIATPQSGGTFVIQRSVLASGGRSSGGVLVADGAMAEALAGNTTSGGMFSLSDGFWGAGHIAGTPTPTPGGAGFESDVVPRPNGDGTLVAGDVVQMRRFATGLDTPDPGFNEFQRADCAPRSALGDGAINSGDVVQVRRYATALDPLTPAGGPTVAALGEFRLVLPGSVPYKNDDKASLFWLSQWRGNGSITFAVEIDAAVEVSAALFRIGFDPARMGKPVVTLADDLPQGSVLTVNDTISGELVILVDSAVTFHVGRRTHIVELTFVAGEEKGSVWLIGTPSLSDAFGNGIDVVVISLADADSDTRSLR